MREKAYDRQAAVAYAKRWAGRRNPRYIDFDAYGGDCTNFVSQCIYAGAGVMNYTKDTGWYYINLNNRAPAWTGVMPLHEFLVHNKGLGPYGKDSVLAALDIGDVGQLSFSEGTFGHSLLVTSTEHTNDHSKVLITTHAYDSTDRPLSTYSYEQIRFIKIIGVRAP